ncbi:MAG: BadF/BadG/BcrA/BcrD ATPase family protein [Bilophila wadsworthia]
MVLLDGLGTPLYSRYVRHHGQPDKVLCAELEALERTHAGIAAAVTGTGADRVGRLLGACAVNEVIAQVAAASSRYPQARSVIDIGGQDSKYIQLEPAGEGDGLRLKDFSVSSMCAGTGSFLDQQATRLGLDIETEFGRPRSVEAPARIAGRCSVLPVGHDPPPAEGHPGDIVAGLPRAAHSFKAKWWV